jgi:hypothetical protein
MDQGRQGRDQIDAAVVPDVRGQRLRLQLHALAYNLCDFLRPLATPEPIKDWSLTSLKEKLIKIGGESREPRRAIPRKCSRRFRGSSRNCGRSHHQR